MAKKGALYLKANNQMNRLIVPTGYMGSGSSAITDLICEFDGYDADNGTFEYVFLHCPDGLFDLEDKLLIGNNSMRSDEAIRSFEKRMYELYSNKYWWVANYKKRVGESFWKYTKEFIESLIQYRSDSYWYMQEKVDFSMFVKLGIRAVLRAITIGKVNLRKPLEYQTMRMSFVDGEEFYKKAKKYINNILKCMGIDQKNIILDQLLLPHNVYRAEKYFDDNMECFVVNRDPRDVFILNKYVWTRDGDPVPFPTDVNEFCGYYKRLRSIEKKCDNPHVHIIQFEDLIYKYDEKLKQIMGILQLDRAAHLKKKTMFDPEKSINNTQLFLKDRYRKEAEVIETKLQDFLYDFPYRNDADIDKSF